jgi:tRNA(Ile)-lysidine synthase
MTLKQRFHAHVVRSGLFRAPGTAVVAVSGGADSVALLDLLHAVRDTLGLGLVVAHADHQIQPGSGDVGKRVGELAQRYQLPFELGELGLGPGASETTARRARYRWLREVQARRGARYLVTAHQRDDQVETVLLRVLSGSAPAGLAGIAARSRAGLVRPLLPFTRAELARHVEERGLPAHEDPANADVRHLRSWVRVALLPLLAARLGDAVSEQLVRVGRHAARERRAWDRVLELLPELSLRHDARGFDVDRATLAHYGAALAEALLRAGARRVGLVLGPTRARRLRAFAAGSSGRRMPLGGPWQAEIAFDRLRVERDEGEGEGEAAPTRAVLASDDRGRVSFGDFEVHWEPSAAPPLLERSGWTTWVDGTGWQLRPYRSGDTIVPLGGVGHRPVRRLLMEARVPRGARPRYPVIARGDTVLWVPGVCRGAAELPAPGTRAVRVDVQERGEPRANGRA